MSDNFDDGPVIATLRRAYFGTADATPDQIWSDYRTVFSAMSPEHRRGDLLTIDNHLATELKPTRETAAMISQRRQLGDIDDLLRRSGR
jgi:hypothetical protein